MMNHGMDVHMKTAILGFITKYSLIAHLSAKNHFIKVKIMEAENCLALFNPFEQLHVAKKTVHRNGNIQISSCFLQVASNSVKWK